MTSKSPSERPALKWLLIPAAALAGATAIAAAARRQSRRSLPVISGRLTAEGLHRPVEVIRDRHGIPHIYASGPDATHDLFFAQGFIHAQDRLFQMDLYRRLGLGRMAEILGPRGLAFDRFAHYLGWPRAAAATAGGGDETTHQIAAAYCAGVNANINTRPLPPEFMALAYRPAPWTELDTAAWGVVLAWGLSCNWETEMLRAWLVEALGPEKAADLTLTYSDDYPTILPDDRVASDLAQAVAASYRDTMAHLPLGVPLVGHGLGSNNWVVGGKMTTTGRPQLANDPHLPATFPALWYGCHLTGGDFDVTGFSLPGVPGIVLGHNAHVAWGFTNAFPDIQDTYIERFDPNDPARYEYQDEWRTAELVTETIPVRGRRSEKIVVRFTHHGPVFSDVLPGTAADLSLNWTLYHGGSHLQAVLEMNRARDANSFRESLRHWSYPGQNIVYADVAGDIGYMMPGRVPVRTNGLGMVPAPGWTGDHEWQGWIPFDELPGLTNPPQGFIATANNTITGDSYPHHLTSEWLAGYRARRITDLLAAGAPLSIDDHREIQNDTVSLLARRFLAAALPILAKKEPDDPDMTWALRLLGKWDGNMTVEGVEGSLYFAWLVSYAQATIQQATGETLAGQLFAKGGLVGFPLMVFHEISYELAVRWLEGGCPGWVGDVHGLLRPSLRQALDTLHDCYGPDISDWRWGQIHQIVLAHEMSPIPGIGRWWKPVTLPAPGDGFTVNQHDLTPHFPLEPVTIIPSCRLIMDVGAWDNSLVALPGGQSGHPGSVHYQDLVDDWSNGRYFRLPFSRAAVEKAAEGTLWLDPHGN